MVEPRLEPLSAATCLSRSDLISIASRDHLPAGVGETGKTLEPIKREEPSRAGSGAVTRACPACLACACVPAPLACARVRVRHDRHGNAMKGTAI